MKHILLKGFVQQLNKLPVDIQEKFWKQLNHLLRDLNHPSLHAKKYDEQRDIWQARADKNIRFYFLIKGDTYILLYIGKHPK